MAPSSRAARGTERHSWLVDICRGVLPWSKMLVVLILWGVCVPSHATTAVKHAVEVYWNKTSSMFESSNNLHNIEVHLGDRLQIICPLYSDGTVPSHHWEYYVIYMVDSYNYELCVINDTSTKIVILNCSSPEAPKSFTLLIFEFQPIPGIPDFQIGKKYYFITTSGGRQSNMDNQYQGACRDYNMKMVLSVTAKPTESPNLLNKTESNQQPTSQLKPSTWLSTTTTTTTTSTTTTTETPRPTTRKPSNSRPTDKVGEGEIIPGSDGFPDEETVIHVGDSPNINSGVIADSGMESTGWSIHCLHRHFLLALVYCGVSLLLRTVLLRQCFSYS